MFLQPNTQSLPCLKLSDYLCLFPELYLVICILTDTERHIQAPNVLALIPTQWCWSFVSYGKCPAIPFFHVCSLLLDYSLSCPWFLLSLQVRLLKDKISSFNAPLLAFLIWLQALFVFSFSISFFLLSWTNLLICHSRLQLLSSSPTARHITGAVLKWCKRQGKRVLSGILLPK